VILTFVLSEAQKRRILFDPCKWVEVCDGYTDVHQVWET
jgi:hypothetical protein